MYFENEHDGIEIHFSLEGEIVLFTVRPTLVPLVIDVTDAVKLKISNIKERAAKGSATFIHEKNFLRYIERALETAEENHKARARQANERTHKDSI